MTRLDRELREYFDALIEHEDSEVPTIGSDERSDMTRRHLGALVGSLAVVAALLLGLLGWALSGDDSEPGPAVVASDSATFTDAPLPPRFGPIAVWTGREMIVVGGAVANARSVSESAAYDPVTQRWRRVAGLPTLSGEVAGGVWAGDEAIFLGMSKSDDQEFGRAALFLYSVGLDRWQSAILPRPLESVQGLTLIWTGAEALVWGYPYREPDKPAVGLAFDPKERSWRALPSSPLRYREKPSVVWSGSEMLVFGGDAETGPASDPRAAAAYTPDTDSWRDLPLAPQAGARDMSAVWTGKEAIFWGGNAGPTNPTSGVAYAPALNRWREITAAPQPGRNYSLAFWTGRLMVVADGIATYDAAGSSSGRVLLYDPTLDQWSTEDPGQTACGSSGVWTGSTVLIWGGLRDCSPNSAPVHGVRRIAPAEPD